MTQPEITTHIVTTTAGISSASGRLPDPIQTFTVGTGGMPQLMPSPSSLGQRIATRLTARQRQNVEAASRAHEAWDMPRELRMRAMAEAFEQAVQIVAEECQKPTGGDDD